MAEFVDTEIDCRTFKLWPNPYPAGSMAYWIMGSPRDQWTWWWQEQRLHRRGETLAIVTGEIGTFEGITFIETKAARKPA